MNLDDLSLIEPMYVQDKLAEIIPTKIDRYNDQWQFKCPICGDSRKRKKLKRGHYYIKNNSYWCFNEGCSASGLWIIVKMTGMSITDVKKDFIGYVAKHFKKNIEPRLSEMERSNISKLITKCNDINDLIAKVSANWTDLPEDIRKYLEYRKVFQAPYLPKDYKFYWNTYNERLVIPWMDNGRIVYYQDRLMDKDAFAKYVFPKDISIPVAGLEKIGDNCHHIFMMEGFLDHVWVPSCVCIGSIHLSDHQKRIFEQFKQHKTVFFPDNQWTDPASYKKSRKIALENPEQLIYIWPRNIIEKDVNEFVINHTVNIFDNVSFLESRIFKGIRAAIELDHVKF